VFTPRIKNDMQTDTGCHDLTAVMQRWTKT